MWNNDQQNKEEIPAILADDGISRRQAKAHGLPLHSLGVQLLLALLHHTRLNLACQAKGTSGKTVRISLIRS
jgi:hypothetical protein